MPAPCSDGYHQTESAELIPHIVPPDSLMAPPLLSTTVPCALTTSVHTEPAPTPYNHRPRLVIYDHPNKPISSLSSPMSRRNGHFTRTFPKQQSQILLGECGDFFLVSRMMYGISCLESVSPFSAVLVWFDHR